MKSLTLLSTVALALIVGMAGATAQTRAKQKVTAASPESRVKMCMDMYKGQYRNQGDGWVFLHGYCLSNVRGWGSPQASAGYGGRAPYFGEPVGGGGGEFYARR
jgi:hypothetical protein